MNLPDEHIPASLRGYKEPEKPPGFAVMHGKGIGVGGPWDNIEEALDFIPLNENTKNEYQIINQEQQILYNWDHDRWVRA